jgi:tRNA(His) 5'-end guanylyltransferase
MDTSKDALGARMKAYFEDRAKTRLLRRVPVIIRLDGRSFSRFCKRFEKPFDKKLHDMLNNVMVYLCSKIQGAKFAERHSDEISIVVTDYDTLQTDAFFDYEVGKICSITAGLATSEFCKQLIIEQAVNNFDEDPKAFLSMSEDWPVFDSRCFNLPESEVVNYVYWRNLDCTRSSINMLGQSKFSHKEMQNKNCNQVQEMLFQQFGINWNDLPQCQKSGFICVKETSEKEIEKGPKKGEKYIRSYWAVKDAPRTRDELVKVINVESWRTNNGRTKTEKMKE